MTKTTPLQRFELKQICAESLRYEGNPIEVNPKKLLWLLEDFELLEAQLEEYKQSVKALASPKTPQGETPGDEDRGT